jgi:hypothetical protein
MRVLRSDQRQKVSNLAEIGAQDPLPVGYSDQEGEEVSM